MKKILALLLCLVCLMTAVACGEGKPSSNASAVPSQASTVSIAGTSSASTVSLAVPVLDPAKVITATQYVPQKAETFTVDTKLREEYFDYFAQNNSYRMPRADFTSVDNISNDEKVRYAIKNAEYIVYNAPVTETAVFDYNDVQYASLKYLGVQIDDLNEVRTYSFDPGLYRFIDSMYFNAMCYHYRLEELSVDASGVYTAVFKVYQEGYASAEKYEEALPAARANVTADTPNVADYRFFSTVTVQFVKMIETAEDAQDYLRFVSMKTVREY